MELGWWRRRLSGEELDHVERATTRWSDRAAVIVAERSKVTAAIMSLRLAAKFKFAEPLRRRYVLVRNFVKGTAQE